MIDSRLRQRNSYLVDMDRRIEVARRESEQPSARAAQAALASYFRSFLAWLPADERPDDPQVLLAAFGLPGGHPAIPPQAPILDSLSLKLGEALSERGVREYGIEMAGKTVLDRDHSIGYGRGDHIGAGLDAVGDNIMFDTG